MPPHSTKKLKKIFEPSGTRFFLLFSYLQHLDFKSKNLEKTINFLFDVGFVSHFNFFLNPKLWNVYTFFIHCFKPLWFQFYVRKWSVLRDGIKFVVQMIFLLTTSAFKHNETYYKSDFLTSNFYRCYLVQNTAFVMLYSVCFEYLFAKQVFFRIKYL